MQGFLGCLHAIALISFCFSPLIHSSLRVSYWAQRTQIYRLASSSRLHQFASFSPSSYFFGVLSPLSFPFALLSFAPCSPRCRSFTLSHPTLSFVVSFSSCPPKLVSFTSALSLSMVFLFFLLSDLFRQLEQRQVARLKFLLFSEQRRARRIKKIKSKVGRKKRKQVEQREEEKIMERLEVENPTLAEELRRKFEEKRAKIRLLRQQNARSKWASVAARFGGRDMQREISRQKQVRPERSLSPSSPCFFQIDILLVFLCSSWVSLHSLTHIFTSIHTSSQLIVPISLSLFIE